MEAMRWKQYMAYLHADPVWLLFTGVSVHACVLLNATLQAYYENDSAIRKVSDTTI